MIVPTGSVRVVVAAHGGAVPCCDARREDEVHQPRNERPTPTLAASTASLATANRSLIRTAQNPRLATAPTSHALAAATAGAAIPAAGPPCRRHDKSRPRHRLPGAQTAVTPLPRAVMSKSFRRSSCQGLRTGLTAPIEGATEHALAEQIALATSGAVHIRLLASRHRE